MPNATVPAAVTGLPKKPTIDDQFEDLQSDIYRVRCMALMLSETIEEALFPGIARKDKPGWYFIDQDRRDVMSFASRDIIDRLEAMEKHCSNLFERFRDERELAASRRRVAS